MAVRAGLELSRRGENVAGRNIAPRHITGRVRRQVANYPGYHNGMPSFGLPCEAGISSHRLAGLRRTGVRRRPLRRILRGRRPRLRQRLRRRRKRRHLGQQERGEGNADYDRRPDCAHKLQVFFLILKLNIIISKF